MPHKHIVGYLLDTVWAIYEPKAAEISAFISHYINSGGAVPENFAAAPRPSARRAGAVAVLPVFGALYPRANMMAEVSGGTSMQVFNAAFAEAVANPEVKAIVLDIDSPGGAVTGIPETVAHIMAAREDKYIVAVANNMAASAAYWLGSAANEFYVTPSGEVGSIGVLTMHQDFSKQLEEAGVKSTIIRAGKYKADRNPYEPLSDETKQSIQAAVDEYYNMFISAVAKGRGVPAATVRAGFGEGRMVLAKQAVAENMVDGIATLEEVLAKLGAGNGTVAVYNGSATRRQRLDLLSK